MTDKKKLSILLPEFDGVMHISGYRGVGKSYLASQIDLPQNIVFFDFEAKGKGIDSQLQFGSYRALTSEATPKGSKEPNPLLLFDISMEAFANIEGEPTVAIIDNVSPLETAIKAEAVRNVDKYCRAFNLNKKNVLAGRYGGANAVMNYFIPVMVNLIRSSGVKVIVVTSHISHRWNQGVQIPNKYIVKGGDKWQELSILTLILTPGKFAPIPAALVQKEMLGQISVESDPTPEQIESMMKGESGHEVRRRLPYRIPKCTFQQIRWYMSNPVDFDDIQDGEEPLKDDVNPFSEELSKEQFSFLGNAIKAAEREEKEANRLAVEVSKINAKNERDAKSEQIIQLSDEGFNPSQIASKLKISPKDVVLVLKGV